eukprot:8513352-Ditylum_brightwellii.AAC.1
MLEENRLTGTSTIEVWWSTGAVLCYFPMCKVLPTIQPYYTRQQLNKLVDIFLEQGIKTLTSLDCGEV